MKREPIGYIYMFTNRINGKKYIGQHEYKNGIDENYFGSGSIFASAKEKYGIENFKFDILCWCNTREELDNAESYFIGFKYYTYANTGRGYNIADGGNGGSKFRGKTEEEMKEIREKISEVWNNKTEEEKKEIGKKISEVHKGHEVSEETRKKMSEVHKGHEVSEETRKKLSEAKKGKTLSEEHKKKLSEVNKGENHPMYGKHHSEETRKKMSEVWNNKTEEEKKEIGKKISDAHSKKVRCIEENRVFNSLKEASEWCGMKGVSNIAKQIRGELKSTGKHPITGEKLHWEYVDEETIETNLNLSLISNISISLQ